jgi:alcohol dehydrogenase
MVFAPGALDRLGEIAKAEGARRVMLVTDPGLRAAGYERRAARSLYRADLVVALFDQVEENPTTLHVEAALKAARKFQPDFLVGLGGGSSMDCAKGLNFLLSNGGHMQDYWGVGKATKPMLPMIAVPTTAGTGSEAQSFALITDPQTHQKMACGDKKALCRVAILDPDLTLTQPPRVAAAAGIDAIAHAVETAACNRRNDVSRTLSRQAWLLLESAYEPSLRNPGDADARKNMLLGAHLAGAAIENSMLGAAHALANPLTGEFAIPHGVAVGLMLPHVVRFNAADGLNPYADLLADAGQLAARIEKMLAAAALPRRLHDRGVGAGDLPRLADLAAKQWTAAFNPRPVGAAELLSIYQVALG